MAEHSGSNDENTGSDFYPEHEGSGEMMSLEESAGVISEEEEDSAEKEFLLGDANTEGLSSEGGVEPGVGGSVGATSEGAVGVDDQGDGGEKGSVEMSAEPTASEQ